MAMVRDRLIREALERTNWDLLVCAMPANVLLLSGTGPPSATLSPSPFAVEELC